tara:strand:+ start:48 stop:557 length:510 start_codon:yes stop_codon:yes gene_type:complete
VLNYPLLKTAKVDEFLTDFLNKKFNHYIKTVGTKGQKTTPNLLLWPDKEYQNFLNNEILNLISKEFSIKKEKIKYVWTHMLEYKHGGKLEAHNHMHNEDFVFFIYLNSCKSSGETVFYLNSFNEESQKRTKISVLPTKNLSVCFSALLTHEGCESYEGKKVFVVGFRLL